MYTVHDFRKIGLTVRVTHEVEKRTCKIEIYSRFLARNRKMEAFIRIPAKDTYSKKIATMRCLGLLLTDNDVTIRDLIADHSERLVEVSDEALDFMEAM